MNFFTYLHKKDIVSIIVVFLTVYFSLLIQNHIIFPIEKELIGSSAIDYVSLFYLPHGVKIVLFFIFRGISLIPIFLGTYIYGFSFSFSFSHLLGSFVGVLSIYLAFYFCSFLLNTTNFNSNKKPIWRILLVVVIISALVNSILQSVIASYSFKEYNLNLLYLTGDILGSVFIIFLLITFRDKILKFTTCLNQS